MAGQPSPVQGVLALFDPLLGSAPPIVEVHYPFRASRHVRDDEAHPSDASGPVVVKVVYDNDPAPSGHYTESEGAALVAELTDTPVGDDE